MPKPTDRISIAGSTNKERYICAATLALVAALFVGHASVVNSAVSDFSGFVHRLKGHESGKALELDKVITIFTLSSAPIVSKLQKIQLAILVFSSLLLVGIGVFVFEPMIRLNRRQKEELDDARARAEEASRMKSSFLANMSHEIRTPMNGVMGMIELALQTELTSVQREFLESGHSSAEALLYLLNDILDLSKIESGRMELEEEPFVVRDVVRQAMNSVKSRAQEKGIGLRGSVNDNVPAAIVGDRHRLLQILTNLLGNAVKFTDEGEVALKVASKEHGQPGHTFLQYSVSDTGIGIPENKLRTVFSEFEQADSSTTRRFGGTGLGLSISRQLSEMMNGALRVKSQVGVGSTFRFEAPFPVAAEGDLVEDNAAQDSRQVSRSVLVADDSRTNQRVAAGMLEHAGHVVSVVNNGLEAVEAWKTGRFEVIIMDARMPEMDGLDATRIIRGLESENQHTLIIGLSASAMTADRDECLAAGMDVFLSKPVNARELRAAVQRHTRESSIPASGPEAARDTANLRTAVDSAEGREAAENDTSRLQALPNQMSLWSAEEAAERVQGDRELLEQLLAISAEELPNSLGQLETAVENADAEESALYAHRLKGAATTIAANQLADVAWTIESAAGRGDLDTAQLNLPNLRSMVEELLKHIHEFQASIRSN